MIKVKKLFFVCVLASVLFSCGLTEPKTPEEAYDAFQLDLNNGDWQAAYQHLGSKTQEQLKLAMTLMLERKQLDIGELDLSAASIESDPAKALAAIALVDDKINQIFLTPGYSFKDSEEHYEFVSLTYLYDANGERQQRKVKVLKVGKNWRIHVDVLMALAPGPEQAYEQFQADFLGAGWRAAYNRLATKARNQLISGVVIMLKHELVKVGSEFPDEGVAKFVAQNPEKSLDIISSYSDSIDRLFISPNYELIGQKEHGDLVVLIYQIDSGPNSDMRKQRVVRMLRLDQGWAVDVDMTAPNG